MRHSKFSSLRLAAILPFVVFTLAAGAADLKWPERADDPYPCPKGKGADKALDDRWAKASKKPLGTDADAAAVKKTIVGHIKGKNPSVGEIRWLSPTLVMASAGWHSGPRASAGYYYVVKKTKHKWEIVTYYMLAVS